MPKANIHRRQSLERVYPPDAFASDAAEYGLATNQVVCGVGILSAPDAAGDFEFERTGQQVGEAVPPTFLAPHRHEDRLIDAGRDSPAIQSARPIRDRGTRISSPISSTRPSASVSSPTRAPAATSHPYKGCGSSRAVLFPPHSSDLLDRGKQPIAAAAADKGPHLFGLDWAARVAADEPIGIARRAA